MAYFNIRLAESKGIRPQGIFLLQLIFQNKFEDMGDMIEFYLNSLNDDTCLKNLLQQDYLTMIKGKPKDSDFKKLRLSKKGKKLYDQLQTVDTVQNDFEMFEYVKKIYLQLGKDIGDEKNTVDLIAWFRCNTGFNHKQIFVVLNTFVNDETQMQYSNILEYVFWKRPHIHAVKPNLKDSRLWNYYNKRKEYFTNKFAKLPNDSKPR